MENNDLYTRIHYRFNQFEKVVTICLAVVIGMVIIVSLIRIMVDFYKLFALDVFEPTEIAFEDYQLIFAKVMTLLISLEFLNSIIKVLRSHKIRDLVLDVILITALAIARKLIIYDYDKHDAVHTLVYAGLLMAIGLFYFLVKYSRYKAGSARTGSD